MGCCVEKDYASHDEQVSPGDRPRKRCRPDAEAAFKQFPKPLLFEADLAEVRSRGTSNGHSGDKLTSVVHLLRQASQIIQRGVAQLSSFYILLPVSAVFLLARLAPTFARLLTSRYSAFCFGIFMAVLTAVLFSWGNNKHVQARETSQPRLRMQQSSPPSSPSSRSCERRNSNSDLCCNPLDAGILTKERYVAGEAGATFMLPIECQPFTEDQEALFRRIRDSVARMTFANLHRDFKRATWLVEPDRTSQRSQEVVPFEAREIVRVVQSLSACKERDAAQVGSKWLQQIYALRFDHGMDLPTMELNITSADLDKCKQIYPKAAYGLCKPHGYPIMWDMVSSLRVKKMIKEFGSVEAALEKILWYDLHIMELFERHKRRLSKERGGLHLIKGVQVVDLGAWSSDLLNPSILRTVQKIIARSGCIWLESLWRIYLVNVPWVFQAPWRIIKQGCHPVTLEKVKIFSSQDMFFSHLESELGITPDMIPRENGGQGPSLYEIPYTPTANIDERSPSPASPPQLRPRGLSGMFRN
jgi:hypothetical protein